MGKKLFFLSLIVLSVAMGAKWHKTRPPAGSKQVRQRVALNLDDLQLQDDQVPLADGENMTDVGGEDSAGTEGTEDLPEDVAEGGETENANAPADGETPSATSDDNPLLDDPIMLALKKMKRDPFERSPYAKLVEDLQKKEEMAAMPVEKKSVQLLAANFTATIETRKELVAVIDSRLYRKGDAFGDKKIADIKTEIISLESGKDTFLIPKRGVNVNIAEDGSYTVDDSYHKN
ncbi:MAG: hypothetical protein CVV42_09275 [Candidatus Riflebacteria bacterium HGW-Riflebacteria-2]|jgi:hypothetical protein|nr:MAG: hypothetical protein CVV42_09275 [Candidatus Riflebacteria bacterium HGW-Riflebacteria-2]